MNGLSKILLIILLIVVGLFATENDFNGDGKTDILW